jgi:GDP-4-dehydro-6-deoxy-D-mannose reductase
VRILVTGADGFVGGRLVRRLAALGHDLTAAVRRGTAPDLGAVAQRPFDLADDESVRQATRGTFDAVAHLAAVSSNMDAGRDPGLAWEVNAAGTARLCEAAAGAGGAPLVLIVSTAEVYGALTPPRPRRETDATVPCSPYAASKLGAEVAAQEVARRTGLRVIVARPFPHTGAGQDARFVVPAFARRIHDAVEGGRREVAVGNLDPVRDFLHVDDVVEAYVAMIERGRPGAWYNVASEHGVTIREVFERLRTLIGADVTAAVDPALARSSDIPHLVGDAGALRADTGWTPRRTLDDALNEVARAQAH